MSKVVYWPFLALVQATIAPGTLLSHLELFYWCQITSAFEMAKWDLCLRCRIAARVGCFDFHRFGNSALHVKSFVSRAQFMGLAWIYCKFISHKLFKVWRQSWLFLPFIHHFSVNRKKLHIPERLKSQLLSVWDNLSKWLFSLTKTNRETQYLCKTNSQYLCQITVDLESGNKTFT